MNTDRAQSRACLPFEGSHRTHGSALPGFLPLRERRGPSGRGGGADPARGGHAAGFLSNRDIPPRPAPPVLICSSSGGWGPRAASKPVPPGLRPSRSWTVSCGSCGPYSERVCVPPKHGTQPTRGSRWLLHPRSPQEAPSGLSIQDTPPGKLRCRWGSLGFSKSLLLLL